MEQQVNNPLHGVKLQQILEELIDEIGWIAMGERVKINCFTHNPTIGTSLKFLRKNQWARDKVEAMWLEMKKFHK